MAETTEEQDAHDDWANEVAYRRSKGGRYDPELGGWIYPDDPPYDPDRPL